jgi:hypothetical protein
MFEGDTSVRLHFTLDVVMKLAVRAGGQSAHNRIDARRASWLEKAGLKLDEVTGLELVRHVERAPSRVRRPSIWATARLHCGGLAHRAQPCRASGVGQGPPCAGTTPR